jgi:hypothetical protein
VSAERVEALPGDDEGRFYEGVVTRLQPRRQITATRPEERLARPVADYLQGVTKRSHYRVDYHSAQRNDTFSSPVDVQPGRASRTREREKRG